MRNRLVLVVFIFLAAMVIPSTTKCHANNLTMDFNSDGIVNWMDLFIAASSWEGSEGDGITTSRLLDLIREWGLTADIEPTPTSTLIPEPTASPTPPGTPIDPNLLVTGLRLRACFDRTVVNNYFRVFVDQVDQHGNILNTGVAGVTRITSVTAQVSGNAIFFISGTNTEVSQIDRQDGLELMLLNLTAETVVLTVESPNLAGTDTMEVTFVPGGSIRSNVRVFDEDLNDYRPAQPFEVRKFAFPSVQPEFPGAGRSVQPQAGVIFNVGLHPDDNYTVRFDGPGQTACVTGVPVTLDGPPTELNVDLEPFQPTGRIEGNFLTTTGFPLQRIQFQLTPVDPDICTAPFPIQFFQPFPTDYAFENLPDGTYRFHEIWAQADVGFFEYRTYAPVEDYVVTISGGETVIQDILLDEIIPLTYQSPENYAIVNTPPTLRWEVPEGSPGFTYSIWISSLCDQGTTITGITDTEYTVTEVEFRPGWQYYYLVEGVSETGKRASSRLPTPFIDQLVGRGVFRVAR